MTADAAQQLSTWLEQFDYHRLQDADDVRTKFVLPLFRQLGYANSVCRRDYHAAIQAIKPLWYESRLYAIMFCLYNSTFVSEKGNPRCKQIPRC